MDTIIRQAIRLRDNLKLVADELMLNSGVPGLNSAKAELLTMDTTTCADAAKMIEKLGTEVTRLRLGIGHLYHGKISLIELNRMAESWNGGSATRRNEEKEKKK